MSWDYFRFVDAVLSPDSGLTPPQRLLLQAMARHGEICWASQGTLSKRTGLARETVNRATKELRGIGWLAQAKGNGKQTRAWKLCIPPEPVSESHMLQTVTCAVESQGSARESQGSATESQPPVSESHTKESFERAIKEPVKEHTHSDVRLFDTPSESKFGPDEVAAIWNRITIGVLPKVSRMPPQRRDHVNSRLKAEKGRGPDWWEPYFQRIVDAPFCRGQGDKGWKASFDWAVRSEDIVARVFEGMYEQVEGQAAKRNGRGRVGTQADWRDLEAEERLKKGGRRLPGVPVGREVDAPMPEDPGFEEWLRS